MFERGIRRSSGVRAVAIATVAAIGLAGLQPTVAVAAPQAADKAPAISRHDITDFSARKKRYVRRGGGGGNAAAAAAFAGIIGTVGAIAASQARRDYYENRYYGPGYYGPGYGYYGGGPGYGYYDPY
ncbi:hypothetical protein [Rhodopseudomonas telluris]|uniref:Transmembrane protein n=1 Tax=Rhodopseudomonas telluris TaxID=644215 RepID=A0ABV6ELI1_9BRAD